MDFLLPLAALLAPLAPLTVLLAPLAATALAPLGFVGVLTVFALLLPGEMLLPEEREGNANALADATLALLLAAPLNDRRPIGSTEAAFAFASLFAFATFPRRHDGVDSATTATPLLLVLGWRGGGWVAARGPDVEAAVLGNDDDDGDAVGGF